MKSLTHNFVLYFEEVEISASQTKLGEGKGVVNYYVRRIVFRLFIGV